MTIVQYGETEINALKAKDKKLCAVIDAIGIIERDATPDLFLALVESIVSQQISGKAADTIIARLNAKAGGITPATLAALSIEDIQQCGTSFRKAEYICSMCAEVINGTLDIDGLYELCDEDVVARLSALKGIGRWTAEMVMLFSMQRQNILSYDDLAIHRGLRMIYHHEKVSKELFEKYRKRYSPYCSVASLYIWEVAGGMLNMRDYAKPKKKM